MAFRQERFYAPELKRYLTLRSLSAAGAVRLSRAQTLRDAKARRMALMLETVRDGVADYEFPDNAALMDFAARYPDLTARLFLAIRQLNNEAARD